MTCKVKCFTPSIKGKIPVTFCLKTHGKHYQSLDLKSSYGGDSVAAQRSFKVRNL